MMDSVQITNTISWKTWFSKHVAELRQRESQVFLALALVIGALTGLAVVAFIMLTERLGMRLYPMGGAPWRRALFPVAARSASDTFCIAIFRMPVAAACHRPKLLSSRARDASRCALVLGKFFCTSATLASGIPLGREGPSVQVGAGIASVLGRSLGLPPEQVKKLIPVGAAAAIAAAFNTPLAAVLFSLEEIMGDLHAPVMGAVVLASATAWMVLRVFLGDHPLFKVPQYQLIHPAEFAVYAVLGVAGGVVSAMFTKLLLGIRARFLRFPLKTVWFQPLAGGLVVGLMGWFVPQVLGVGYGYVGEALNGEDGVSDDGAAGHSEVTCRHHQKFTLRAMLAVSSGRRLFIGAMLGGTVGTAAHPVVSQLHGDAGRLCVGGNGWRFFAGSRARADDIGV